jgi:copper chaperone NosL
MNKKLSLLTRIAAGGCVVLLTAVLFLPMWRIELSAPQYPEGLVLQISPSGLQGDVDIVNGLNHYIGMRTLHTKDFVEFMVLPYIIGALAFFGLLSVVINRKWFFITWTGFYILFSITAMIDFYRWEYNYGHNLDPTAPIQVQGMSYQPPLIGYKQLLNFGAYSIPDTGGWIFAGVGLLLFVLGVREIRQLKKATVRTSSVLAATTIICLLFLASCSTGSQPIQFGSDGCYFCKMTITDIRYGGELVTKKGKAFKFDDMKCLISFLQMKSMEEKEIGGIYLVDFAGKGALLKAGESLLLESNELHAPMGGNIAAFGNNDSLVKFKQQLTGTVTNWDAINK